MTFILSFLGSKVGRYVLIAAGAALAVLIVLMKVFNAGKRSVVVDSMERALDGVKQKTRVEERVEKEARDEAAKDPDRSPADVKRDRLRDQWTSD